MARWSYTQVEGVLYGMSHQPQARPVRAASGPSPVTHSNGPRGPFPETVRRLDMSIAVKRLDEQDRDVLTAHYLRGAKVSKAERRSAVKRLVILLGDLDSE